MLNKKINTDNTIASLVESDKFAKMDTNMQSYIIETVEKENVRNGGVLGKFLGTNPSNVSMHIAFVLCVILLILLVIDFLHSYFIQQSVNMELVNTIIPVVTLSLGYIFGKGSNS